MPKISTESDLPIELPSTLPETTPLLLQMDGASQEILHQAHLCVVCGDPVEKVHGRYNRTCSPECATDAIRLSKMGDRNPAKRPDVRARISATVKLMAPELAARIKQVHASGRMPYPGFGPVNAAKASERMKRDNPMRRPDVAKRMGETQRQAYRDGKRPRFPLQFEKGSTPERALFTMLSEAGLPIVYSGDRTFWIGPCQSGRRRNPDMRHSSERRAILFSGRYWHTLEDIQTQMLDYHSVGWSVLHFWEESSKDPSTALALAREFLETGFVLNPLPSWATVVSITSV